MYSVNNSIKCTRNSWHMLSLLNDNWSQSCNKLILHRAFLSAGIPATLEPSGLSRSDGKRPDGLTLVPWEWGKPLLWDTTIPDSLDASYRPKAISEPGAVAAMAESKKATKYAHLSISHIFTPVAVESLGAFGSHSLSFIHALGHKIRQYSGNELATSYLL